MLLVHTSSKFGQSTKASLIASKIKVAESLILRFDTEDEENAHLRGLKY